MEKAIIIDNLGRRTIILNLFLFVTINVFTQNTSLISGKVIEQKTNQPVPYATIRLTEISNDTIRLLKGTISDDNGNFSINRIKNGIFNFQVTSVGYKKYNQTLIFESAQTIDMGAIFLRDSSFTISETVVVADRIKGKSEASKAVHYIITKMLNATGSAPELLKQIPGVQVDLKHNISLNGNSDILFFVDGKEYDKSYISQLVPSQIDKIEVLNTPPSNYDGNISGVINIILKKEKQSGLSGHFFSEIPTTTDVVYLFPTCGLNYNYGKINLYTSYNGEINYENIDEITNRQIIDNTIIDINSLQQIRQKNLSNKFHYGVDYYLTSKDVLNFYGFYNQYSYEQDGKVTVEATGKDTWTAQKDETDKNLNFFHSLYYKHQFNDERKELIIDISNSYISSENDIDYFSSSGQQKNNENPRQTTTSIKADYNTAVNNKLNLSTGVKVKFQSMHDETSDGFSFNKQIYALYSGLDYKSEKYTVKLGVRAEDSEKELNKQQYNSTLSLLPYASVYYKVNEHNDLSLTYRRSVNRPSVYQLNPYSYTDDPYTLRVGNSLLNPEFRSRFQLEYSTRFKTNFLSAQLFFETISDAINNLIYLNDNNNFVTQLQNLGDMHQYGLHLKGALKFGILSITPTMSLYNQSMYGKSLAKDYGIDDKNNLVFTSGISSIISLKKDFAVSAIFQYATAKENIQDNNYCDALYFISFDKKFKNNLKIGIVSALPFAKTFVYQGTNIYASNFTSKYTGNLKLPTIPLMFRINYLFSIGKNRNKINREKENVDTKPKVGF